MAAAHAYGGEAHAFGTPLRVPTVGNGSSQVDENDGREREGVLQRLHFHGRLLMRVLALLLGLALIVPQSVGRIGNSVPKASGGGGGGDNLANTLTSANFTYLGAFYPPDDGPGNVTVRNIAGTDYLYSTDFSAGTLREFTPVADVNLETSPPFNTGTLTTTFGDTYGTNLVMMTGCNGLPAPPVVGLTYLRPNTIFWNEPESKMYWTNVCVYEPAPNDFDTGVGRGTIDRSGGTGTSEGMWALAYRPSHTGAPINDALVDAGNRWINAIVPIPTWFQTYVNGNTLAAGCGNPSLSIATTGPIAQGLTLFSFCPYHAGRDDESRHYGRLDHDEAGELPLRHRGESPHVARRGHELSGRGLGP